MGTGPGLRGASPRERAPCHCTLVPVGPSANAFAVTQALISGGLPPALRSKQPEEGFVTVQPVPNAFNIISPPTPHREVIFLL